MHAALALPGTTSRPGRRAPSPGNQTVGWEGKLSLAGQFRWASLIVLLAAMLAAGSWIAGETERGVLNRTGALTALYVDSVLQDTLGELAVQDHLSADAAAELDHLAHETPLGQRIVDFRVWSLSGEVLYSSSDSSLVGRHYGVSEHLARALRGWVVADLSNLDEPEQAPLRSRWTQLLEVYTPVHQETGDGRTIAAVEFYQRPDDLARQITSSRMQIWALTGGATLLVYLFLAGLVQRGSAIIARQQAALGRQVAELEELHQRLRESAGRTTTLNDKALRRIGADLHAGPGQGLALALLRMEVFEQAVECGCLPAEDLATVRGAVSEAMAELRTISGGLRLPQLEALPVAEVVRRAVSKHERRTGHAVRLELGALPDDAPLSVRIVLFRTLEEALSNASRHAAGSGLVVRAWPEADGVALSVADDGPGFAPDEAFGAGHLGLAYVREQAELLGGRVTIDAAPGRGTRVQVWLPSATLGGRRSTRAG